MAQPTYERLFLIQNPNSTRAGGVEGSVLDRLYDADIPYEIMQTPSSRFEDNVYEIMRRIRVGDRVISLAGDGTGSQAYNAVLQSGLEGSVQLGFLPFGNINDQSRAFNGTKADIMQLVSPGIGEVGVRPMEIIVDGEFHRFSPAYTSLGWTALAASIFDNEDARGAAKKSPESFKLVISGAKIAREYFRSRNEHLWPFHTSRSPEVRRAVTDVLAVNLPNMGRVIGLDWLPYLTDEFAYKELDVCRIPPNAPFLIQSVMGHMPHSRASEVTIYFEEPSSLRLQGEGETIKLRGRSSVTVRKGGEAPSVKILHQRPIGRSKRTRVVV